MPIYSVVVYTQHAPSPSSSLTYSICKCYYFVYIILENNQSLSEHGGKYLNGKILDHEGSHQCDCTYAYAIYASAPPCQI